MNPEFSKETEAAIKAARQAGEKIVEIYRNGFSSSTKEGDGSPVTKADIVSNEILLRELLPLGYPILSEESADSRERLMADPVWIIDPLDGTSDFIRRTGEFSVMIALVRNRVPVAGIIYQPTAERLFVAEEGRGAWSIAPGTRKHLWVSGCRESLRVITSRSHLSEEEKLFLEHLSPAEQKQMGSAGLKVAEIASANADLYFTTTDKMKQWDTAAAHCLISEAGGRMTDMRGEALYYNTEDVSHRHGLLVTNGLIHDDIINRYRAFEDKSLNDF